MSTRKGAPNFTISPIPAFGGHLLQIFWPYTNEAQVNFPNVLAKNFLLIFAGGGRCGSPRFWAPKHPLSSPQLSTLGYPFNIHIPPLIDKVSKILIPKKKRSKCWQPDTKPPQIFVNFPLPLRTIKNIKVCWQA
jgi:hypothetical protein